MQSWDQIDLTAKVQTVRRKTRPWKAIIALVLAVIAGVVAYDARERHGFFSNEKALSDLVRHFVWAGSAVAFCAFGSMATYGLAGKARQILEPRAGASHAAVVRYTLLIVGALTTLVLTLDLFGVPVGQLVLGGALTSVFVGIAAQQSLSNVFAGLVLLFARPFRVGDAIRLRAGALGGQIEGTVTEIGITYVRLDSGGGIVAVPNSQVLNAVVGPVPAGEDAIPPAQAALPAQPTPDVPAATPIPAASGNPAASAAPAAASEAAAAATATAAATAAPAPAPGHPGTLGQDGASGQGSTPAQGGMPAQDGERGADRADRQQPPAPPPA